MLEEMKGSLTSAVVTFLSPRKWMWNNSQSWRLLIIPSICIGNNNAIYVGRNTPHTLSSRWIPTLHVLIYRRAEEAGCVFFGVCLGCDLNPTPVIRNDGWYDKGSVRCRGSASSLARIYHFSLVSYSHSHWLDFYTGPMSDANFHTCLRQEALPRLQHNIHTYYVLTECTTAWLQVFVNDLSDALPIFYIRNVLQALF
jgi:hypothetical protein